MIGLEIHQRLDTKKLFCECDGEKGEKIKIIKRKLHPVLSEMGEMDKAALEEYKKNRIYEYIFYEDHNCLVEADEEPPHEMRKEAIEIAIAIAKQLNMEIVDQIYVMRKIVIDGSNTSGFQRTAIIGMNGYLETSKGKVKIETLALEEESAGIVEKNEEKVVYSLDRLGIPLVEITTAPDIKDGDHLREVAEKIGLLLRATGKVKRGIGTIRQDINVSIPDGARVEIKGAQDLKMLKKWVEWEIKRQEKLIEILKKFHKVESKIFDLNDVFINTESKLIKNSKGVYGIKLEGYKGILGIEIGPNRRFGSELSDYAKKAGVKGIIHSDEKLEKYRISEGEIKKIEEIMNIKESDAFVLVAADEKKAKKALNYVLERINMNYIPKETRKANPNGSTSYMRPLPGKARMYPETDIPPIETKEILKNIKKFETFDEKKRKIEKILNKEMANRILKSRNLRTFEEYVEKGYNPKIVANTLEQTLVSLRREGYEINPADLEPIFKALKNDKIVKNAIPEIIKEICKGSSFEKAIEKYRKIKGESLKKIIKENKGDIKTIMAKYRLHIDAKELLNFLKSN